MILQLNIKFFRVCNNPLHIHVEPSTWSEEASWDKKKDNCVEKIIVHNIC